MTTTEQLAAIEARIHDCRSYNFGMVNANRLAREDAPALLVMVRDQQAKLDKALEWADDLENSARMSPETSLRDTASRVAASIRAAITTTEGTK